MGSVVINVFIYSNVKVHYVSSQLESLSLDPLDFDTDASDEFANDVCKGIRRYMRIAKGSKIFLLLSTF